MSAHTPGPWSSDFPNGDDWIRTEDGDAIVRIGFNQEHREANAHLIAAAPELLEALKAITHRTDLGTALFHKLTEEHAEAALAAIAKAEGR
jgi:hypothetical protein